MLTHIRLFIVTLTLLGSVASSLVAEPLLAGRSYGSFLHFDRVPNVLFFQGKVNRNDTFEFRKALRLHEIDTIVLSSPGGNVFEALNIAGIIFDKGLTTYIPKGELCESACSFLFFAGKNRFSEGKLGVHQFYSSNQEKKEKKGKTELIAQYTVSEIIGFLNEFKTPPFVFERMFSTQFDKMYFFSEKELGKITSQLESEKTLLTFSQVETFLYEISKLAAERDKIKLEEESKKVAEKNKKILHEKKLITVKSLRMKIQKEMNRIGCSLGPIDGKIGRRSKDALARFNKLNKSNYTSDEFFETTGMLEILKTKEKEFCPSGEKKSQKLKEKKIEGLWKATTTCALGSLIMENDIKIFNYDRDLIIEGPRYFYPRVKLSRKKPNVFVGENTKNVIENYLFELSIVNDQTIRGIQRNSVLGVPSKCDIVMYRY